MCGRYYIETESDLVEIRKIFAELSDRYFGQPASQALHGGEIFPSQAAPVIRPMVTAEGVKLLPDLMQWGFPGKTLLINARAETAASKPTFRQALHGGRILVPATSFFEWQQVGSSARDKTKLRLYRPSEPVFYMAGLYRPIPPEQNPNQLSGQFVILTGAANASVAPIHDRMPLVLPRHLLRAWLQQESLALELLTQAIRADFTAVPDLR